MSPLNKIHTLSLVQRFYFRLELLTSYFNFIFRYKCIFVHTFRLEDIESRRPFKYNAAALIFVQRFIRENNFHEKGGRVTSRINRAKFIKNFRISLKVNLIYSKSTL